ncbi:MAG: helix-turn-helix domain-containing protein [Lachnospiraceae bacterium]|nr:helix-turn-helix domain-containing protein [Lachnospiraceae bacterium]
MNTVIESGFQDTFEMVHRSIPMGIVMPPHVHDAIEIYLVRSDIASALVGAEMIPFPKDTLLVIPPKCVHRINYVLHEPYERYILTVGEIWLKDLLGKAAMTTHAWMFDAGHPVHVQLTPAQSQILCERFNSLGACGDSDPFWKYQLFFQTMSSLSDILGGAVRESSGPAMRVTGSVETVSHMVDYIHQHLSENLTTEKIADSLYINHDYAARIFKKHVHTTVKSYITLERMTRARRLLAEGYTISQTQQAVGYNSYEHFFRTFKKNTGMTPREYQVSVKEKVQQTMNSEMDRDLLL